MKRNKQEQNKHTKKHKRHSHKKFINFLDALRRYAEIPVMVV